MIPRLKNISLKTKMALSVTLLFIAFGAIMACGTLSYFERQYDKTIARHQYALVSALASGIDNKLLMAQNVLVTAAARIPRKLPATGERPRCTSTTGPPPWRSSTTGYFSSRDTGR